MTHDSKPAKVALVTGGARRLGAHIVRCLHAEGMDIALHFRASRQEAEALRDELNALRTGSAQIFEADLRNRTAITHMAAEVKASFSRLDVLVNNASSFHATPLDRVDDEAVDDLLDTNLKAPLFLAQAAAAALRESHGCIVNIADIYGMTPISGYAPYCAAKAGLIMLTRALALELAPDVRVNAVAPGAILWPESGSGEAERAQVIAKIPMSRSGEPEDIARAVLFLARDARYVTGQVIKVDGGRAIG